MAHTLAIVETLVKERKEVAHQQERCEDATHRLHIAEKELADLEGHIADDADESRKRPLFGPNHRGCSPGKGRTNTNQKRARQRGQIAPVRWPKGRPISSPFAPKLRHGSM